VAIALRENCEIYVDDELMYSIKFVELEDADEQSDAEESLEEDGGRRSPDEESFQDFLKRITPSDFKDS